MYVISPRITPREIEVSRVLGTTEVVRESDTCILSWSFYFGDFSSGGNCRSEWKAMPGGLLLCIQATHQDEGSYVCAARAWEPGMGELTIEFHFWGDRAGPLTLRLREGAHCEPVWFCNDKFAGLEEDSNCVVVCKVPIEASPVPDDHSDLQARMDALSGGSFRAVVNFVMRRKLPCLFDCEEAVRLLRVARDMGLRVLAEYCDSFLAVNVDRRSCLRIMAGTVGELQGTEAFRRSLCHFVFFFDEIRLTTAWRNMKQQQRTTCTKILIAAFLNRPNHIGKLGFFIISRFCYNGFVVLAYCLVHNNANLIFDF